MKIFVLALILFLSSSNLMAANIDVDEVFTADNLGTSLSYFEYHFGPVWRASEQDEAALYKIGKCVYEVRVDNEKIVSIGLNISKECNPDLRNMNYGNRHKRLFGETFDSVNGIGQITADCLVSCGNSRITRIYSHNEGPHAADYVSVVFGSAEASTYEWGEYMIKQGKPIEYTWSTDFNCTGEFQNYAVRLFKDATITYVRIEKNVKGNRCDLYEQ